MKKCTLCNDTTISNGQSWCDACRKNYLREYRKTHKEHIKLLNQNWRKNNANYSEEKFKYYSTVKGRLVELTRSAKRRSKKKSIEFNIDSSFLFELWNKQKGICALTGLEMIIPIERNDRKASPYSPSIDRIDPNQGYTKNNIRLVCYAVNCSLHDYEEKIFQIIANAYINKQIPSQEELQKIYNSTTNNLNSKQLKDKKYREGMKGIVTSLFNQSKKRAKENGMAFNLTKNIIENLLLLNECAVTHIPLNNKLNGDYSSNPFRPSIDRIDPSKGYTKDNVRIVCVAVNFALNEFSEEVFQKICKAYLKSN